MIPDGFFGREADPWEEGTIPGINLRAILPLVTHKSEDTPQGLKHFILDAALEPIDSTFKAGKVEKLIEHWQAVLYGEHSGKDARGAHGRMPGEER